MSYRSSTGAKGLTVAAAMLAVGAAAGTALGRGPGKSIGEFGAAGFEQASAVNAFGELNVGEAPANSGAQAGAWVRAAGSWVELDRAKSARPGLVVAGGLHAGNESAIDDAEAVSGPSYGSMLGSPAVSRLNISPAVSPGGYIYEFIAPQSRVSGPGKESGALAELSLGVVTLAELFAVTGAGTDAFAALGAPRWTDVGSGVISSGVSAARVVWGGSFSAVVYVSRLNGDAGSFGAIDAGTRGGETAVAAVLLEGIGARAKWGIAEPAEVVSFNWPTGGRFLARGPESPKGGHSEGGGTTDIPGPGAAVVLGLGGLLGAGRRRRGL